MHADNSGCSVAGCSRCSLTRRVMLSKIMSAVEVRISTNLQEERRGGRVWHRRPRGSGGGGIVAHTLRAWAGSRHGLCGKQRRRVRLPGPADTVRASPPRRQALPPSLTSAAHLLRSTVAEAAPAAANAWPGAMASFTLRPAMAAVPHVAAPAAPEDTSTTNTLFGRPKTAGGGLCSGQGCPAGRASAGSLSHQSHPLSWLCSRNSCSKTIWRGRGGRSNLAQAPGSSSRRRRPAPPRGRPLFVSVPVAGAGAHFHTVRASI